MDVIYASVAGPERDKTVTVEELSARLFQFAVRVGKVVDALPETRMGRHVAGQLARCGTAPAVNFEEARACQLRSDLVLRLHIVQKDMRESRTWLRFTLRSELLPPARLSDLVDECTHLAEVLDQMAISLKANADAQK